jgi:hypothetical protein
MGAGEGCRGRKVSGILKNFYSPLSRHLQRSISFGYHVWAPNERSLARGWEALCAFVCPVVVDKEKRRWLSRSKLRGISSKVGDARSASLVPLWNMVLWVWSLTAAGKRGGIPTSRR